MVVSSSSDEDYRDVIDTSTVKRIQYQMQLSGGIGSLASLKESSCKNKSLKLDGKVGVSGKTAAVGEAGEGLIAIEESVSDITR